MVFDVVWVSKIKLIEFSELCEGLVFVFMGLGDLVKLIVEK